MIGIGEDGALPTNRILKRFWRDSPDDLEAGDVELEKNSIDRARLGLLDIITAFENGTSSSKNHVIDEYCSWYIDFLETRFRAILKSHLEPCLENLEGLPDGSKFILIYKFVAAVAESLSSRKDLALQEVVTELEQRHILKTAAPHSHQLTFIVIGWLTMLYDPDLELRHEKLQISTKVRTSGKPLRTQMIWNFQQDFSQVQQPLNSLFRVFGHLIPQPEPFPSPVGVPAANLYYSEYLILSCLCYNTLHKVAKVKIEWVDALNLHLDFDVASKVLKIFRFPSYCRMIYTGEGEPTFLNRLVKNSRGAEGNSQGPQISDFFREVLLSYRLLFGQDRSSWKTFISRHKLSQATYSTVTQGQSNGTDSGSDIDDLLQRLCGSDWRKEDIYNDIQAGDASTHYCRSDFPFLGERLLILQNFSKGQHPHDWKVLWDDRRDLLRFYTFWAVIFLGASTIVVGLVQVVLAGVQIAATYQQNQQFSRPHQN